VVHFFLFLALCFWFYAAFHWDRELAFTVITVITRSIPSQTRTKPVNTSRELVILATSSIFVTNEKNWQETTKS